MAQCFELSLLPGVNASDFENVMSTQVFPHFQILRRNVRGTVHRLLKIEGDPAELRYIWLVFVDLVGDTPQTAGEGPEVLASGLNWLGEASQQLSKFATVSSFSEVITPTQAAV